MEQTLARTRPQRPDREVQTLSAGQPSPGAERHIHSYALIGGLLIATLLMMSAINAPHDQWYLAYVCMVPWLVVIGAAGRARRVYATSWVLGLAFYLINMWWMEAPTGMGYVVLSACLACYFPLAACPIRHAVRRGIPLAIVVPFVWVAAEYLRAIMLSGFPWFFLAHSHYKILSMIQISDLVGAYGVTFVLAAVNGAIADVTLMRFSARDDVTSRPGRTRVGIGFAAALMAGTIGYGRYQLSRDTIRPGPRIAVMQQDYPNFTDREQVQSQPGPHEKARAYFAMMAEAKRYEPDIYLFPETAWGFMYLNKEFREVPAESLKSEWLRYAHSRSLYYYAALRDWSAETGASVVIGSASVTPTPLSLRATETRHNSVFHITPDGAEPERHDKIHPVLLGETVPFRYGRLRSLYLWLNSLSPFGEDGYEYSLTAGDDVRVFTMTTREPESTTYRFGAPICYEDVMPYVCRRFVWDKRQRRKRVDFLLNISNDGWFLDRNEQQQHFAICTFRAVENRVGIARTVNTGISGFIDPDGRAHDTIGVGQTAYKVARVTTDSRTSLYSRMGDIFAGVCVVVSLALYGDYVVMRAVSNAPANGRAGSA